MIVVSDASAIIALSSIDRLDLLHTLYQNIYIPTAVYQEICSVEETRPGVDEVLSTEWITTHEVQDGLLVNALKYNLDQGEAEAIVLAIETDGNFLLMDERRGRRVARSLGIHVVGVLGILVEAKQKGLLPTIKPLLDTLTTTMGFHISQQLYKRILETVGENNTV